MRQLAGLTIWMALMSGCGSTSAPQSGSEAAKVSKPGAGKRMPGASTILAKALPGTTSYLHEGILPAQGDAEFLVGEEKGSILLAHAVGSKGHPQISVHRSDTGRELDDRQENASFWIARVPETMGYLVAVHSFGKESHYSIEIETPRELKPMKGSSSIKVASFAPAHGIVSYIIPPSASLKATLISSSPGTYMTLYSLNGKPLLKAVDNKKVFQGPRPNAADELILRVNQGAKDGPFQLDIDLM